MITVHTDESPLHIGQLGSGLVYICTLSDYNHQLLVSFVYLHTALLCEL